MLYLAEVKKQSRGFISGFKTELKLLACQHSDKTWSAVPTEEIVSWEEGQNPIGEGSLLLVNLNNNRQIQGIPEPAGTELVRQLLQISRLMGKSKEQQEEIEQWKQSLAIQAQELSRREMEMESRLEQIEQMEAEFEYLERQRLELEEAKETLGKEQQRLQEMRDKVGFSADLTPEHTEKIGFLIQQLTSNQNPNSSPWQQLRVVLDTVNHQETQLSNYQQQLAAKQGQLSQQQQQIEQKQQIIHQKQQELESIQSALEKARTEREVQNTVLTHKQELLGRINEDLQTISSLRSLLMGEFNGEQKNATKIDVEIEKLENIPLGELEEKVNNLQRDLDSLVRFVNEQEEELTLQTQTVNELTAKLETAGELERMQIEEEIKDEQERKKMLDKTLGGQRKTLWEKQEILLRYLRVLHRRQGILDPQQQGLDNVNIEPILEQLAQQQTQRQEEQEKLQTDIEYLQQNLQQLEEMIREYTSQQENKYQALQQEQKQWEESQISLAQLQLEVNVYEQTIKPLEESLNFNNRTLRELSNWFGI